MHATPLMVLSLLIAASAPAFAQDDTTGTEAPVQEELAETEEPAPPSLQDIAASDPALSIREGEDGEADAMVMLSDVLFGFGNDTLEPDALAVLGGLAAQLEGVPAISIKGHTLSLIHI